MLHGVVGDEATVLAGEAAKLGSDRGGAGVLTYDVTWSQMTDSDKGHVIQGDQIA